MRYHRPEGRSLRATSPGHTPTSAEEIAQQCPAWQAADPAAIDLFAAVLTALWGEIAQQQSDEPWKQQLAISAQHWHEHRSPVAV
jgi:hypothetical protein